MMLKNTKIPEDTQAHEDAGITYMQTNRQSHDAKECKGCCFSR